MTERTWQLKAMSVAELLDETIRLYRHNFLTFVGIVALLQVPMTILSTVLSAYFSQRYLTVLQGLRQPGTMPSDAFMRGYFLFIGVILLVSVVDTLVVYNLLTAALAKAISNRYLGETVSIGSAYRYVLGRFWSLLGALLMLLLITFGIVAIPVVLALVLPCLGIIGLLVALVLLVLINVRLAFIVQAVVLEHKTARGALSRSWDLIKGYGWRTFGVFILLRIFALLLVSGPSYAVQFGMQSIDVSLAIQVVISGVLTITLSTLYTPIELAGMTLLYYDLCIRKEGLDLELQAEALESDVVLEPLFLSETDQREIEL
jgi:hypothetical protein